MTSHALDNIPQEPEQISRDWLFEVINQFRRTRDLSLLDQASDIIDCAIDECDQSHGYLSTTYKLLAHFKCKTSSGDEEECSYAFFLKMLPGVEDKHRKLLSANKVFKREVEAHFNLLPKMKKFALQKVGKNEVKVLTSSIPQIVYGSYDEEGSGIMVLMDQNDEGYFPLNHYNGFNLPQLLTVVEKLAEFHAIGSAMLLQQEDLRDKFTQAQDAKISDNQFLYDSLSPVYRDFARFLRRVPGFFFCYDKVEKARPNFVTFMAKAERRNSNFPLKTVLHGELWEKNIMLRFEQISANLEVVFCDWKCLKVGPPTQDLAFLVLACTGKSLRSRSVDQILDKYLTTFKDCISRFGIDFARRFPGFTMEDFRQDYEEAQIGAFLQSAIILTRELKYLEVEFYNAKEEPDLEKVGVNLRSLGRRLLDLADEFVPKIDPPLASEKMTTVEALRNGKVKIRA